MKLRTFLTEQLLAILALPACLATPVLLAQGIVQLNNTDSGMGIYEFAVGPDTAVPTDRTFAEVLGGPSAQSMVPLVNSTGGGPVFPMFIPNAGPSPSGSYFDGGFAAVPGVPADGTGWFQVLAWESASSFQLATLRGQTPIWSQTVASDPRSATAILRVPGPIVLVPEPKTISIVLAACAEALLLRFKKPQRYNSEPA